MSPLGSSSKAWIAPANKILGEIKDGEIVSLILYSDGKIILDDPGAQPKVPSSGKGGAGAVTFRGAVLKRNKGEFSFVCPDRGIHEQVEKSLSKATPKGAKITDAKPIPHALNSWDKIYGDTDGRLRLFSFAASELSPEPYEFLEFIRYGRMNDSDAYRVFIADNSPRQLNLTPDKDQRDQLVVMTEAKSILRRNAERIAPLPDPKEVKKAYADIQKYIAQMQAKDVMTRFPPSPYFGG
ncbi:hypothetical protein ACIQUL_30065 [Streptomyces sp. NPDC090303]|uniref:hypothetical protein n=1 Tax=Streptomyces sp. NPDC090303 TaxID=3365960 RepID=UPI0037F19CC2